MWLMDFDEACCDYLIDFQRMQMTSNHVKFYVSHFKALFLSPNSP